MIGSVLTMAPVVATTGGGGVFVGVNYARLYASSDTGSSRATPSSPRTFQATGVAGVPTTGVGAVVVDISAKSTTGVTNVYARTNRTDNVA